MALSFFIILTLFATALSCQSQGPTDLAPNTSKTEPSISTPELNRAPDFTLPTMEGDQITLSQWEGTPVVLLFWATWCPYCRVQLRYLEKAAREQAEDEAKFLAVNVGEDISKIKSFFGDYQPAMIVALDQTQAIFHDYNSRYGNPGYMPITFFIDSQRVIRQIRIGAFANETELWESLHSLS